MVGIWERAGALLLPMVIPACPSGNRMYHHVPYINIQVNNVVLTWFYNRLIQVLFDNLSVRQINLNLFTYYSFQLSVSLRKRIKLICSMLLTFEISMITHVVAVKDVYCTLKI